MAERSTTTPGEVAEPRFVAPSDKPTDCVIQVADGTRWDVHMARLAGARGRIAIMV